MKYHLLKILAAALFASISQSLVAGEREPAAAYKEYQRLLQAYVKPSGVDYAAWHANSSDVLALDEVLEEFSEVDLAELSTDAQKAFYINLYNAGMLQAVFENYPLKTVTTILPEFGIFKKKYIVLNGRKLSLDDIEKGILLKQYPDPRIHFAVNCASRSCPPLADTPYTSEKLEAQLDKQTRLFAETEHAVTIDKENKTLRFSQLLQWYASDFAPHSPAEYLNQYRKTPLPKGYKTDWITYDWSLNTVE